MKLNAYISHAAGVCSRREAADLVKQGEFNELTAKKNVTLLMKFKSWIRVMALGRRIKADHLCISLLDEPKGYVTTAQDEQGRTTVLDLLGKIKERVYPVGRLDRDLLWALLLTNEEH